MGAGGLSLSHTDLFGELLEDIQFENYGVRGVINSWFRLYPSDRRQSIEIDKCISDTETIVCGVPQCSALGPLLFNCILMASINLSRNLLFIYSQLIQV